MLEEAGHGAICDALADTARPALVARVGEGSFKGDQSIPVGVSKMGGSPDLPPTETWPGQLTFAMQVELSALPPRLAAPLPREGLLSFFYDMAGMPLSGGRGLVARHYQGAVERRPAPKPVLSIDYFPARLRFRRDVTVVGLHHPAFPVPPTDPAFETLHELFLWENAFDCGAQLYGNPVTLSGGDPMAKIARATEEPASDWRLLAGIHSSEDCLWFPGGGCLFVGIRDHDLADGRFDRVRFVVV